MIHNFSYLVVLKALTLILPLVTYPYLLRTLGAEKYGLVMWAWAIAEIFIVFIKFGFDTIGIKYISEFRHSTKKLSEYFSMITYTKLILLSLAVLVYIALIFSISKFEKNSKLFEYFLLFILSEGMFPVWYFQGRENMKVMAILVSSIKIGFALLVFLFIKNQTQYLFIPLLYFFGSFFSNVVAYYIILVRDNISFVGLSTQKTYGIIQESFFIFTASIGTVLRDRVTVVLIEKYLGLESVAYFDLSMRIINILLTPFHIISQVLYPHMANKKDRVLFKKILLFSLLLAFIVVALFSYNVDTIVRLISGEANQSLVSLLKILIFIVPIGIMSLLVADNILIVYHKSIWVLYSMIVAILSYFLVFYTVSTFVITSFAYFVMAFFIGEMGMRFLGYYILILKEKSNVRKSL